MAKRQRFAANHQRSWLSGRNAVLETIRAGRWPVETLCWSADIDPLWQQELQAALNQWRCEGGICERSRLTQLCGTDQHQGIIARMGPFPCGSQQQLIAAVLGDQERWQSSVATGADRSKNTRPPIPLWLICDRIQDAFNLGAILRTGDASQVNGVVIGQRAQAAITPQVARSSAGAVNHVPIFEVTDLVSIAEQMAAAGVVVAGANEKSDLSFWQADFSRPVALIIGNEGQGIAPELQACCQCQIAIPMQGHVGSLNAAVSAGILLYEIRRQQLLHPAAPRAST